MNFEWTFTNLRRTFTNFERTFANVERKLTNLRRMFANFHSKFVSFRPKFVSNSFYYKYPILNERGRHLAVAPDASRCFTVLREPCFIASRLHR